jgi:hypothetical protein
VQCAIVVESDEVVKCAVLCERNVAVDLVKGRGASGSNCVPPAFVDLDIGPVVKAICMVDPFPVKGVWAAAVAIAD